MTRLRTKPFGCLCVVAIVAVVSVVAGCRPELPPDEDAILHYFRNARVHGKVRRVWPEGQKYVDTVLKCDAALQKLVGPFREYYEVESLWPIDDPQWQDDKKLSDRVDALVELIDGQSSERAKLLAKLHEAIQAVPKGLDLAGEERELFVTAVWKALRIDGVDLRKLAPVLEEDTREHLRLYRKVLKSADEFAPGRTGLRLADGEAKQMVERMHTNLDQRLRKTRDSRMRHYEEQMIAIAERLPDLPREKGGEREVQENRLKHLRSRVENEPKRLRLLIERTGKNIKRLEADRADLSAQETEKRNTIEARVAFLTQYIERLEEERKTLRQRANELLGKVKGIEEARAPEGT